MALETSVVSSPLETLEAAIVAVLNDRGLDMSIPTESVVGCVAKRLGYARPGDLMSAVETLLLRMTLGDSPEIRHVPDPEGDRWIGIFKVAA